MNFYFLINCVQINFNIYHLCDDGSLLITIVYGSIFTFSSSLSSLVKAGSVSVKKVHWVDVLFKHHKSGKLSQTSSL